MFSVNQIVKGKVCGTFLILALREIGGEAYAQVKAYNPERDELAPGEFALPLTALVGV